MIALAEWGSIQARGETLPYWYGGATGVVNRWSPTEQYWPEDLIAMTMLSSALVPQAKKDSGNLLYTVTSQAIDSGLSGNNLIR